MITGFCTFSTINVNQTISRFWRAIRRVVFLLIFGLPSRHQKPIKQVLADTNQLICFNKICSFWVNSGEHFSESFFTCTPNKHYLTQNEELIKTSHTFGIQFITRTTKREKDIGKVYVRITVDKARVEISLKKSIPIDDWNKGKGCVKGSNPNAKLLNTYLGQVQDCTPKIVQHSTAKKGVQVNYTKNISIFVKKDVVDLCVIMANPCRD